jgi:hypothetical protein
MPGRDQVRWLDRLAEDHANLRAALRWSVDAGDVTLAQRLAAALWRYFQLGGQLREGRALIDAAIDMPGGDQPTRERMWALAAGGSVAYWQADVDRAEELYRGQRELAAELGDPAGEADATWSLASIAWIREDYEGGSELIERARSLYLLAGDEVGAARVDWGRSIVLSSVGEIEESVAVADAARKAFVAAGDPFYEQLAIMALAFGSVAVGDLPSALRWAIDALRIQYALRDVASATLSLGAVSLIGFTAMGRVTEGLTVFAAFERLLDVYGIKPPAGYERRLLGGEMRALLGAGLSEAEARAARERGTAMEFDEAVAFTIEIADGLLAGPTADTTA